MQYIRLGSSGLRVSKIILGCMSYGSSKWLPWVLDENESIEHIRVAYEAGINTFDTANIYSNGHSEIVLGKAINQLNLPRDGIVVLTKLYFVVGREVNTNLGEKNPDECGYVNQHGLSRKHIFESVKQSLERLQLSYVDVLQCHRFDSDTPIAETMQALHDVVQAGYVRYIGMSSCWAWQFHAMQSYAIQYNLTPFISMQNHHNLVYREEEREMIPMLKHLGVGCIPWSPLARGYVTRPLSEQTRRGEVDDVIPIYAKSESNKEIVNRVENIAKYKGVTMAQVALAWSLSKEGISAAVVGTTSIKHLKDLIGGVRVKLTADEIRQLEEPYKAQDVIGH